MTQFLFGFFALFSFTISAYAQHESLEKAKLAVDTLFFSDKALGLEIATSKLDESKVVNDTFYITYFLDQAGELNRYLGNLYEAEKQLTECLAYKVGWKDLRDLSITFNNLGKTYKMQGNTDAAYANFLEALKLMEVDSNLIGQGYYLNNIGALFDDQNDHIKAIEYYQKSLEIKEETKDSAGMASTALNLGIAYYKLEQYNEALDRFNYAFNSVSYQKSANSRLRALSNISKSQIQLNHPKKALAVIKQSYPYLNIMDDEILRIELYNAIANSFSAVNSQDSAFYYSELAVNAAKGTGASQMIQDVYFLRSDIFEKNGALDSALHYMKLATSYYDSLTTEASIAAVLQMEAKYKTERNLRLRQAAELETSVLNESLKSKQVQVLFLILTVLFIFTIVIFLIVKYKSNQRAAELIKGQNVLIERQNLTLNRINSQLKTELKTEKLNSKQKDDILNNVFSKSNREELPKQLLDLSKRETEVLANLALGLSDDQLSARLFISKSTIKTHLRRIYAKLLVKNRAQAVAIAHKYGIIGDTEQE